MVPVFGLFVGQQITRDQIAIAYCPETYIGPSRISLLDASYSRVLLLLLLYCAYLVVCCALLLYFAIVWFPLTSMSVALTIVDT